MTQNAADATVEPADLPFPLVGDAERDRNQRLRLLMEKVSTASSATAPESAPDETLASMDRRLRVLAHEAETRHADLLALLARFDDAGGWKRSGSRNCASWMNAELGICHSLAREKLRVAHALRTLPELAALFASGRLGWSKIRALTRVATRETELALAATALDMTASGVVRMCEGLRTQPGPEGHDDERVADEQRHRRRSLTRWTGEDGNTVYRLVLTAERAALFDACLARVEEQLFDEERSRKHSEALPPSRPSAAQRRADALVAMADASQVADGSTLRAASRPQVVVTVDADVLAEDTVGQHRASCDCAPPDVDLPLPVRAVIQGSGGITAATAQRIACDADIVTVITENGEPLSIGRKSRVWPEPMVRAITSRDEGCCQFPGCESTRFLQVHHIVHWAQGGETSVRNGCLLCSDCHRRVHEEDWRITPRADTSPSREASERDAMLSNADAPSLEIARRLNRYRPRLHFVRRHSARIYRGLERVLSSVS